MTVRLPLPAEGWYALPLDPADRDAELDARLAGEPADRRPLLARMLTTLAAHYARCELAAVAWDPAAGEPPRAVIQVSLAPWTADLAALLAELAAPRPGDIGPRAVSEIPLPAGAAARVRVLAEGGADPAGRQVVTDVVQYWLPRGDHAVVAASSTAVLTDGDQLADLLDTLVRDLTVE